MAFVARKYTHKVYTLKHGASAISICTLQTVCTIRVTKKIFSNYTLELNYVKYANQIDYREKKDMMMKLGFFNFKE